MTAAASASSSCGNDKDNTEDLKRETDKGGGVNEYNCDDILFSVFDPTSVLSVLPVTSDLLMTAGTR